MKIGSDEDATGSVLFATDVLYKSFTVMWVNVDVAAIFAFAFVFVFAAVSMTDDCTGRQKGGRGGNALIDVLCSRRYMLIGLSSVMI